MEAAIRERFGLEHRLLRPDVLRGTLWLQACAWELIYDDRRTDSDRNVRWPGSA